MYSPSFRKIVGTEIQLHFNIEITTQDELRCLDRS